MSGKRNGNNGYHEDSLLSYFLRDISRYDVMNNEDVIGLIEKAKDGDIGARNEIIECNQGFVISIAGKYKGRGVPLVDLIQNGSLGLITAINKYDPNHDVKFVTYAVWWIRQSILKSLQRESRGIRLPANKFKELHRAWDAKRELSHRYGREPSVEEIADYTNFGHEKVRSLLEVSQRDISIDVRVDDSTLSDYLEAPGEKPDEEAIENQTREKLEEVLGTLSEREAEVLRMYYGWYGAPFTLEKIGDEFGFSKERARVIKDKALRRLRYYSRRRILE